MTNWNGREVLFHARTAGALDILQLDTRTGASGPILKSGFSESDARWSPDSKRIVVSRGSPSGEEQALVSIDLASGKELKLAEQLVSAIADDFEPESRKDEYRERVLKLIEAKARGATIAVRQRKAPKASGGLAEQLRQSVSAVKERRVA